MVLTQISYNIIQRYCTGLIGCRYKINEPNILFMPGSSREACIRICPLSKVLCIISCLEGTMVTNPFQVRQSGHLPFKTGWHSLNKCSEGIAQRQTTRKRRFLVLETVPTYTILPAKHNLVLKQKPSLTCYPGTVTAQLQHITVHTHTFLCFRDHSYTKHSTHKLQTMINGLKMVTDGWTFVCNRLSDERNGFFSCKWEALGEERQFKKKNK